MTEYRWSTTLERGIDLFGETPSPSTESALRAAFATRPAKIHTTIESIGAQIIAGANIRSGWAITMKRVGDNDDDITVQDTSALETKILNARRWLHNAGLYFDRESDVLDELFPEHGGGFDSSGGLRDHDTPQLRAEMTDAWRQERPRGERAEQASADYMAKLKADRDRLTTMKAAEHERLAAQADEHTQAA